MDDLAIRFSKALEELKASDVVVDNGHRRQSDVAGRAMLTLIRSDGQLILDRLNSPWSGPDAPSTTTAPQPKE